MNLAESIGFFLGVLFFVGLMFAMGTLFRSENPGWKCVKYEKRKVMRPLTPTKTWVQVTRIEDVCVKWERN